VRDGSFERDGTAEGWEVIDGLRERDGESVIVGIGEGCSEVRRVGGGVGGEVEGLGVGWGEEGVHVKPLPVNPLLQVQVKPPTVSTQLALGLHGLEEHSVFSKCAEIRRKTY
jgi:hypothetical protein